MGMTIEKLKCTNVECVAHDVPERVRYRDGTSPECPRCGSAMFPKERYLDENGAPLWRPEAWNKTINRRDYGPGLTEMTEKEYLDHLATNVYSEEVNAGYRLQVIDEKASKVAREERRHKSWQKKKARGLDHGVKEEYLEATARYSQEEAAEHERLNKNPEKGSAIGRNKIGTLAEAV